MSVEESEREVRNILAEIFGNSESCPQEQKTKIISLRNSGRRGGSESKAGSKEDASAKEPLQSSSRYGSTVKRFSGKKQQTVIIAFIVTYVMVCTIGYARLAPSGDFGVYLFGLIVGLPLAFFSPLFFLKKAEKKA